MKTIARVIRPLVAGIAAAAIAATALAGEPDDQLRLNTAITVTGEGVRLGDIFAGYLARPEKIVTHAPKPGQRLVLSAEWLRDLANKYGLDWRPANTYDRATVFQPGHTIAAQEILAAAKAELVARGMPANLSLTPAAPVRAVTLPLNAAADIGVREAFFDAVTRRFSVVAEIPPGDPNAQFIPMHGTAYATVTVMALKENAPKNTLITAAMLTTLDVPEAQVKATMITDAAALVGKAPKVFLKAGAPIFENEVTHMVLVDVPVLTLDATREHTILRGDIKFATMNAADLAADVILDPSLLVGRTPRRVLAAGSPLRRGDVHTVRMVRVPVVARDLPRGAILTLGEVTWVEMNDSEVASSIITDANELDGRETKHAIRAGQPLRSYDVARPVAVTRGKVVTIVYAMPMIKLTAQGKALETGGVGDVIRVTNTKSNTAVTAEIVDANTVRVANQQTAMHE